MAEFVLAVLCAGAGVFAASAITRLRSQAAYGDYRAGLRGTGLLPQRLLSALAAVLATAEAVAAGALIAAGVTLAVAVTGSFWLAESALALAAGLMAVLTAGVTVVIRRGVKTPCVCFGSRSARPLGPAHLARNVGLLALLTAGLVGEGFTRTAPLAAGSVLAVAAGLIVALLFIRWEDLAALFTPIQAAYQPGPDRRAR